MLYIADDTVKRPTYRPSGGDVNDMHVFDNKLYIGGDFPYALDSTGGGQTVNNIVYYDGLYMRKMGTGLDDVNGEVETIQGYRGKVYVGGYFHSAGGIVVYHIARWNGSSWERIPNNPFWGWYDHFVWDLEVDTLNNFLYVGSYGGIWRYNGYFWNLVGGASVSYNFYQLKMYKKELYLSPSSNLFIDTVEFGSAARWDGAQWLKLNKKVEGSVSAFEIIDDTLWVGGVRMDGMYNLGKWYTPEPTNCNWLQPEIYVAGMDTNISINDSGIVHFESNNAYAESWQWDFGDGTTDSIQNPVHTYDQPNDFSVSVTVTMDGCTKTATLSMHITGMQDETAIGTQYLGQNQPNPHNGTTVIPYSIRTHGRASQQAIIQITTTSGEIIDEYVLNPEETKITIHTKGLAASVYLYSLVVDGKIVETKKMVIE
ncbi:MAG: PKD domain-containing protein [Bacteroidetes bacterium]|nr:PKD domain-containing protein [Bacteroidota bacterium]MBU1718581.1 PKD domain-containing protein [Bacteroidota bacterium]